MNFKLMGAILIIFGFGAAGYIIVTSHRKNVRLMQQLITAFEFMECELAYRMTPLPELFRKITDNELQPFFAALADELESQISPDVQCCVDAALTHIRDVPDLVKAGIKDFGRNAGCFDVEGQIKGIISVKEKCISMLASYTHEQDVRLRNYQAFALCAGAAVVILLL